MNVRDLLGHSSVRMTERYAHLAPEKFVPLSPYWKGRGHDLVTLGNWK